MQKRGSHIDIVISFVIFVTLLIFIFSIFAPKLKISDQQAIIDYIRAKLISNFTSNLTTFTIQINTIGFKKDCIQFTSGTIKGIIGQYIDENKLIIKNGSNDNLTYGIWGGNLNILTGKSFNGFLKFYYSKSFEDSICKGTKPQCGFKGGCDTLAGYEIGLIREITSIILFNIEELAKRYYDDYEGLKVELGIPPGTEFAFTFATSDGTIIIRAEPDEIPTTNVYSEESPVTYTDNDGNVLEGFLTIKVW